MPVIRLGLLFLALLPVYSSASTGCNMGSQKIIASPETVIMKRAVQPGAVLHSRTYAVQGLQSQNCTRSILFTAKIIGDKSALILPGILQTNAKGIGAKITLELPTGRVIQWPSEFSATADELKGSKIIIELVKIDDNINTAISPGTINLQITSESQTVPVIDMIFPASWVNMLSRSCWVNSERRNQVTLPDVSLRNFTKQGSVAGRKPFDINLVCKGNITSVPDFSLNWHSPRAGENNSRGILHNQVKSGAENIGVQILDGKLNPVNFSERTNFIPVDDGDGRYSIPFFAQYYQFGQNATPGKISTSVYFNINYQ